MLHINGNFRKLPGNYLFSEIGQRARLWEAKNPGKKLIRLGVGDVTLPLPPSAKEAMICAAEEMGHTASFRGYGPEQGYSFLREAICREDYQNRGVQMTEDEIFVSDGIKSSCGDILDLFDKDNIIAICDPVYPAYTDAAAIAGRAGEYHNDTGCWSKLCYLPCEEENGFLPHIPGKPADLVYLCFPNNPTGVTATGEYLKKWVDWANETGAVILFDGAYERFIKGHTLPHSIYEVDGAESCAIEFRSFSKTAGFTGVRCGYTVIPEKLRRNGESLHKMWKRRLAARCNGVSYVVQRGAEAVYSDAGKDQVKTNIAYYQQNADTICRSLRQLGLVVYGGENAPYVWVKNPDEMSSWGFFDLLLNECGIVTTPGAGFGPHGEGYLRLTAFGEQEEIETALERMTAIF